MAAEDHGHALCRELAQQPADRARPRRIKPAGRLVEQQQTGIAQQRGGDAQPLAHPGGVAADAVAGPWTETDAIQRGVDLSRAVVVELGQKLEVRPPREVGVEARVLDEAGDTAQRGGRPRAARASQQFDLARIDLDQPEQGA